jgi:chromosome partitioning protein
MAKKIVVSMYKGGSGKTTTTINLAAAIHQMGKRVLLVDLDPQANATAGVGVNPLAPERNASHMFTTSDVGPREVIVKSPHGFDVIPSHIALAAAEGGMKASAVLMLKSLLAAVDADYDVIIADTAPGEGLLTVQALAWADSVLIPLQVHYWAMDGLQSTMDQIEKVREGLNPNLRVEGILPVMVMPRTTLAREVLQAVQKEYPRELFTQQVDFSIKHPTVAVEGAPIVIADPSHPGAVTYRVIAERIL